MGNLISKVDGSEREQKMNEFRNKLALQYARADAQCARECEVIQQELRIAGSEGDNSLSVPVSNVISRYQETRVFNKRTSNSSEMVKSIVDGVTDFFKGEYGGGVTKLLSTGLSAFFGDYPMEGSFKQTRSYVVVTNGRTLNRFDMYLYSENIRSDGNEQNLNIVVAFKSVVDLEKLNFSTFLDAYQSQFLDASFPGLIECARLTHAMIRLPVDTNNFDELDQMRKRVFKCLMDDSPDFRMKKCLADIEIMKRICKEVQMSGLPEAERSEFFEDLRKSAFPDDTSAFERQRRIQFAASRRSTSGVSTPFHEQLARDEGTSLSIANSVHRFTNTLLTENYSVVSALSTDIDTRAVTHAYNEAVRSDILDAIMESMPEEADTEYVNLAIADLISARDAAAAAKASATSALAQRESTLATIHDKTEALKTELDAIAKGLEAYPAVNDKNYPYWKELVQLRNDHADASDIYTKLLNGLKMGDGEDTESNNGESNNAATVDDDTSSNADDVTVDDTTIDALIEIRDLFARYILGMSHLSSNYQRFTTEYPMPSAA